MTVARLHGEPDGPAAARERRATALAPEGPALGHAVVLEPGEGVDPRREVDVRVPGGAVVRARMAMPLPYEPSAGDTVLVIGDAGGHYVIGVLEGRGRTVVELHGDVDLRALGGVLRLQSDRGVRIDAPEVEVLARRLRTVADAVVESVGSFRQRVRELLSVHAAQSHTVVDGASVAQAKSTTILSEEKVTINGKAVHLG
jgi:hypothetical protein